MTRETISVIIGLCGLLLSAVTFLVGRLSARQKSGQEAGQMISDLGYIKRQNDEITSELKELREETRKNEKDLAAQARDIKTLYERVDRLEKRIDRYHEGGGA